MDKKQTKRGDVFAIPLTSNIYGYGQVLAKQWPIYYMTGFDFKSDSLNLSPEDIIKNKMIFFGNFFDVLLKNGRWIVIGNTYIPDEIIYPCYKVIIDEDYYVESWDRKYRRLASEEEIAFLENRKDRSPIILENAIKSHFGMIPWDNQFNGIKRIFVEQCHVIVP